MSEAISIFNSQSLVGVDKERLSEIKHILTLDIAGRVWRLSFNAIVQPIPGSAQLLATFITCGGLALSFLLYIAQCSTGSRNRAVAKSKQLSTDLLNSQEDLRLAETVFANSSEGLMITDVQENILAVNKAFTRITGFSAEEAINQTPRILKSHKQDEAFYQKMWQALNSEGCWQGELWNRRKNGSLFAQWLTIHAYRNLDGDTERYICLFRDITEDKSTQDHIRHLAYYDALTDLANRSLLEDRMCNAIFQAKRNASHLAVLFIDLDRFKTINDSLGHQFGDKLLQQVAKRLKSCVRESDTVARLGGDEFIVLLTGFSCLERVTNVMSRISNSLKEKFSIEHHLFSVSASTGISLYPKDGHEPEALLKHADTAMYQAKEAGGNNYQLFNR